MTAPTRATRADELEAGMTVAVSDTSTLTVGDVRKSQPGEVDIRWSVTDQWATVPADRDFAVIEEEAP